jgi:hypothetical protein
VEVLKVTGWGLMPEFRFYLTTEKKPAPLGLFIGVYARERFFREAYDFKNVQVSSRKT